MGFNVLRSDFVLGTHFYMKTNHSSFLLLWLKLRPAPEVQTLQFIASQEQFLCFCLTVC